MGSVIFLLELNFFRIDACTGTSKLTSIINCTQIIYKLLPTMKMLNFDFVWNNFSPALILIKIRKRFAQNGVGSIPTGITTSCFSVMFPTVNSKFSIKCWITVLVSYKKSNTTFTFLPQKAFPLVLTLIKVFLPPWKTRSIR